jgi:hypothetical protein
MEKKLRFIVAGENTNQGKKNRIFIDISTGEHGIKIYIPKNQTFDVSFLYEAKKEIPLENPKEAWHPCPHPSAEDLEFERY